MQEIYVETHSGKKHTWQVENYNLQELLAEINNTDDSKHLVLIGDALYSKFDILYAGPPEQTDINTK